LNLVFKNQKINPQYFQPLKKELENYLNVEHIEKIERAFNFSDLAHINQSRQSGEPYITHPTAVAIELAKLKQDHHSIIAGLLHDTVEDCGGVTLTEIRNHFGTTVAKLVDGVTKLDFDQHRYLLFEQKQNLNLKKMILAMSQDIRVIIIKLCDRLHNISTISHLRKDKIKRICNETLDVYLPISKKLGIHVLSKKLEECSFKLGSKGLYRDIVKRVNRRHKDLSIDLKKIEKRILEKLAEENIAATTQSRKKSIYSIYRKITIRRIPFREINDLIAIRVIVDNPLDCYKVLGIIHSLYTPNINFLRDYIALPKPNGYQSLHTIVNLGFNNEALKNCCAEIQIRTKAMDYIANYGAAAHASVYKNNIESKHTFNYDWIQDLLEVSKNSLHFNEFMEHIKHDLNSKTVYVFSPNGKIHDLPLESTALDFAFKIHTDIGLKAQSCKINGEIEALATVLQNGQTVEILTDDNCTPSVTWLEFAQTTKARVAINQYLMKTSDAVAMHAGKNVIEHLMVKNMISTAFDDIDTFIQSMLDDVHQQDKVKHIKNVNAFYIEVGRGNFELLHIFQLYFETKYSKLIADSDEQLLYIERSNQNNIIIANCCYPLPGDKLKGEPSIKGIKVHRLMCRNFRSDSNAHTINVTWAKNTFGLFFSVLKISCYSEIGVLEKIARIAAKKNVHIDGLNIISKKDNLCLVELLTQVDNRKKIANLIRSLRQVEEIQTINRLFFHRTS